MTALAKPAAETTVWPYPRTLHKLCPVYWPNPRRRRRVLYAVFCLRCGGLVAAVATRREALKLRPACVVMPRARQTTVVRVKIVGENAIVTRLRPRRTLRRRAAR